jgi:hypothetical protein
MVEQTGSASDTDRIRQTAAVTPRALRKNEKRFNTAPKTGREQPGVGARRRHVKPANHPKS